MKTEGWKDKIITFDVRRNLFLGATSEEAIEFAACQFIEIGNAAISEKKAFFVALSGGSTPIAIYKKIASPQLRDALDFSKVFLFFSDERNVSQNDRDSNYKMAMDSAFASLPVPKEQIFPMPMTEPLKQGAEEYQKLIEKTLNGAPFDLVMLGIGEDGHTASLFPKTHALHSDPKLLVAQNYVPEKRAFRMTLTFSSINSAKNITIYVLGKAKAQITKEVLLGSYDPDLLPAQRVGTATSKALWVLDQGSASLLSMD